MVDKSPKPMTAADYFCQALLTILHDTEGVVIELDGQKYWVFREGEMMRVNRCNDPNAPVGSLCWMNAGGLQ